MENVIEGNKLIAEFMGGVLDKRNYRPKNYRFELPINGTYSFPVKQLKYHSSWDWLMPVVEKISRIEFDRQHQETGECETEIVIHTHYPRTFGMLNNKTGNPMFRYNCGGLFESDTLIEAAWLATVDFIISHP